MIDFEMIIQRREAATLVAGLNSVVLPESNRRIADPAR
jgi:hypothetical protein